MSGLQLGAHDVTLLGWLKRGLTLAELVVAMGILAAVALSATALFLTLLGSSSKSSHLTAGSYFARQRLEEVIRRDLYWPVPAAAQTGLYTVDKDTQTRFFHRVNTTPVAANPGLNKPAYWVEVEVWWWSEAPDQSRAGQGRLSTKLGRLHYPRGIR